jgi:hypothetical protein
MFTFRRYWNRPRNKLVISVTNHRYFWLPLHLTVGAVESISVVSTVGKPPDTISLHAKCTRIQAHILAHGSPWVWRGEYGLRFLSLILRPVNAHRYRYRIKLFWLGERFYMMSRLEVVFYVHNLPTRKKKHWPRDMFHELLWLFLHEHYHVYFICLLYYKDMHVLDQSLTYLWTPWKGHEQVKVLSYRAQKFTQRVLRRVSLQAVCIVSSHAVV